ncbi:CobW family GTP-binding protein [Cohnella thailandensis]|uniref:GTP-binding protein n=1 Tax=Cohnella thailandensis TaxID=557557 RepID=A0A841T0E0_9BACL|nr:GTP-binding protein [Cohnella thailandensis]MBB6637002.1 GTP-binding protein [Cohnella thailandensis]MBP1973114.1 G3E family GTPase [Cohnella thailandensis]
MEKPVYVYLLSGFLGSGKTTLLQKLIREAEKRGQKSAVLMNEAGEVNLDGLALDDTVPMSELLGGCICCSIKSDVGMELLELVQTHKPDIVWIEATGVAQPLEIIDAVTETSLYAKLELQGVLTVVDARHLLDRLRIGSGKTFKLMKEQIRVSSTLLLNKSDLVGEKELRELRQQLREWNPHADIVQTVRCEADWSSLWTRTDEAGATGILTESIDRPSPVTDHGHQERHLHPQHDHHHDHEHINVWTRYLDFPLDSVLFEQFLKELPDEVYRAKGIVTFTDTPSRFLFQYAYKESDFMRITPQKTVHDVLVFIGEDFSRSDLEDRLLKLGVASSV